MSPIYSDSDGKGGSRTLILVVPHPFDVYYEEIKRELIEDLYMSIGVMKD